MGIGLEGNWFVTRLSDGFILAISRVDEVFLLEVTPFEALQQTVPGLVNVYIAMENHHAINGKIHYFYGHVQ